MRKQVVIFFGRFHPERVLAGEIRMLNVRDGFREAFEKIYPGTSFIEIDEINDARGFIKHSLKHPRLLLVLASPFHQVRIFSFLFLKRDLLSLLGPFASFDYYDFDDDPSRLLKEYGMKHTPEEYQALENLRELTFRSFRTIIFTGKLYASDYPQVEGRRKLIVPNASDPAHITVSPLPRKPIVGMVGGAAPGRGIFELIEACLIARKSVPNLSLYLALDSIEKRGNLDEVAQEIKKHNWIKTFQVDYSGVSEFLAKLLVGVIPYRDTPLMNIVMPLKLFDYMAAGRPIVSTKLKQIDQVIRETQSGVTTGFDPQDMAKGIVAMLKKDPHARAEYSQNGRAAVEFTYNWKRSAQIFAKHLRDQIQPG